MPDVPRNFQLPHEINALFDELCEPMGSKQKWLVMSAAIVSLAMERPERRDALLRLLLVSRTNGTMGDAVVNAKTGKLRPLVDRMSDLTKAGITTASLMRKHAAEHGEAATEAVSRKKRERGQ